MEKKYIKLKPGCSVNIISKLNKRFLLLQNSSRCKYILLPTFVRLQKKSDTLCLCLILNTPRTQLILNNIYKQIFMLLITQETLYNKKLLLKGLGFRITFSDDKKELLFKVGFSYLLSLKIVKGIDIKIKKNVLIIEGTNKVLVGNFAYKVKYLRTPDCYKGKGFWEKYQNITLKKIKKK